MDREECRYDAPQQGQRGKVTRVNGLTLLITTE